MATEQTVFTPRWRMRVGLLLLLGLTALSIVQARELQKATTRPAEWKKVEEVFGFAGDVLSGDVIRFNMPRADLHVTVAGLEIKPALALGAWAAFHQLGPNDAMVMGDLVLIDEEVAPVMLALQDGGVEVTALHNHLLGESPHIMYVHMGGHGDPLRLAQTVKKAVALTKTPPPQHAAASNQPGDFTFDVAGVEKIVGHRGTASGGVLHFAVPRAERLTEEGMETPPSMGAGTSINFQPTGRGAAAIAGDFAMTWKEVEPVMKTLRASGIETVAVHSHALNDEPRLLYLHFWANADAVTLARGLRRALDLTNAAK